MNRRVTIKKYRWTMPEQEEYTEKKYVWWCKFLRWLFKEEFEEFIRGLEGALKRRLDDQIEIEMRKYKARVDDEILEQVEIAKPAIEITSDLDKVSIEPEPVLVGHEVYQKRLVSKKNKLRE